MKIQTFMNTSKVLITPMLVLFSMAAMAGPYGFDLHSVLAPKAAGMAGTTLAGDSGGPVEAVFGNPANLVDFRAGPGNENGANFTFGATFYYPEAVLTHENTGYNGGSGAIDNVADVLSFGDYKTRSQAELYTVPQIAFTQDLAGVGIPVVLGLGFSVVSGIGVDYRDEDATNGLGAEMIALGVNAGFGYKVLDNLDVGFAATISYSTLEAGFAGTDAQGHDYGIRYTLGADYALTDRTNIAFQYQTELQHSWDDAALLSNDAPDIANALADKYAPGRVGELRRDCVTNPDRSAGLGTWDCVEATGQTVDVDQPTNIALGISHKFNDHFRVMSDIIFKDWSEASFWNNFYHDQTAFSIGAELDRGPFTWRAGYGYANDPTKDNIQGNSLEGHDWACTGSQGHIGGCFPLAGPLGRQTWRYLQAAETPVIYEHRVTAGMTWDGFLAPFLSLDAHIAYQIEEDREYDYDGYGSLVFVEGGAPGPDAPDTVGFSSVDSDTVTEAEVESYHLGFALSWKF